MAIATRPPCRPDERVVCAIGFRPAGVGDDPRFDGGSITPGGGDVGALDDEPAVAVRAGQPHDERADRLTCIVHPRHGASRGCRERFWSCGERVRPMGRRHSWARQRERDGDGVGRVIAGRCGQRVAPGGVAVQLTLTTGQKRVLGVEAERSGSRVSGRPRDRGQAEQLSRRDDRRERRAARRAQRLPVGGDCGDAMVRLARGALATGHERPPSRSLKTNYT